MVKRLGFDFETNGLFRPMPGQPEISELHCVSAVIDNDEPIYFADPEKDAECGKGEAAGDFQDFCKLMDEADLIYGHNIVGYDLEVAREFLGWEPKPDQIVRDTMVLARMLWPDTGPIDWPLVNKRILPRKLVGRHSLEAWGYRLRMLKGTFGKEDESAWERLTPEMIDYCLRDGDVTRALYARCYKTAYSQQALELEHDFAAACERQMRKGVWIDPKKYRELEVGLVGAADKLHDELVAKVPPTIRQLKTKTKEIPFNPRSRDQVARHLMKEYGWEPDSYTPGGKPKLDAEVAPHLINAIPEAEPFITYLDLSHRCGQMFNGPRSVAQNIRPDGRIHGYINHCGANTGRCTHSFPNTANIPSSRRPWGAECRGLFAARDGFTFMGADAKGIELRALGHYLAPFDGGEYLQVVLTGDPHTMNQEAAGLPTRDHAKTFIYAMIYGGGPAVLGAIAGGNAALGKKLKARLYRNIPALRILDEKVKEKAKKQKWLKGLDGRVLWVRAQHAALNLLFQSFGAITMKQATVNVHKAMIDRGWSLDDVGMVLHVHDEMQFEVRNAYVEEMKTIIHDGFSFVQEQLGTRCPIEADVLTGTSWAETH